MPPTVTSRRARRVALLVAALAILAALALALAMLDRPLPAQGDMKAPALPLPAAQPPAGLAFSVVMTGRSQGAQEALIVGGGRLFTRRWPAQAAVLVTHPKGTFLFDSGLGRRVDEQFSINTWLDQQFFAYEDVVPAADQLRRAGWPLERVQFVVPSHMHWDHVSGLPDFPHAEVWVRPEERAHAEQGHAPAFLASQFQHVRQWRDLVFDRRPYPGFEQSLDMFGDGSVVFVPLTGHTAGQVGMFLTLPSGQRYFFTGDVTWTLEGLQKPADRSWLLRQMLHLDHDEAANQACIRRIHHLMRQHPEVIIVPAHDEHVLAGLPHFPRFQH